MNNHKYITATFNLIALSKQYSTEGQVALTCFSGKLFSSLRQVVSREQMDTPAAKGERSLACRTSKERSCPNTDLSQHQDTDQVNIFAYLHHSQPSFVAALLSKGPRPSLSFFSGPICSAVRSVVQRLCVGTLRSRLSLHLCTLPSRNYVRQLHLRT